MRMSSIRLFVGFFIILLLQATPILSQSNRDDLTTQGVVLTIDGEVAHPMKFTLEDLAKIPHSKLTRTDENGTANFEAIPLTRILGLAGVPFGEKLEKHYLTMFLLVESIDGSQVVFSLPEIDSGSTSHEVLLADKLDGQPLGPEEGPLRILAYSDKRQTRWIKRVRRLSIVSVNSRKTDNSH